ncbi:PTS transporter subunit EIIC [Spiroplasma sp. AdecLV25b]|uniref:PTS transporter subunit EIIC n=1 Tax=Spiroplasma sp. AdecLV25b TaxID=3027162 RepID=UPI0027E056F2|nr:PTS transporter subunit EIIC [Spiroplasma sp. AdecLV25b]
MKKFFHKRDSSGDSNPSFSFKGSFNKLGGYMFGRMQNLARAIVLPIATLPIAGLLLGIGGGVATALGKLHNADHLTALIRIFGIMQAAGNVVFANLGLIFAISIAFGFVKASKGVAALSGFITFAVMTSVINGLFFYDSDTEILGFDPWNLGGGASIKDDKSGVFGNVLGLFPTIDTSVLGGILVGWLISIVHNRSYNIRMPRVLAFFGGERFVPILAVFLGLGMGLAFFFIWPALLVAFKAIGQGLSTGMNTGTMTDGSLTGGAFHPTVGGAFIAMFFGITERLLIPTGLHHVQYTPFWYTSVGGTWTDETGKTFVGAYNIFFAQFASGATGHMNQTPGTMFMSGRFAFMQYGYPFAALAMWKLARPENKKLVGGILGSAALTSFLTGITEPMLFSFLFVAPLCFAFHAFMAGISFMMAYLLNIVVGQGFAAGFIDFSFFGILPAALGKATGFYWIFVTGLIMAPAYYFGFYYIIKWRNYKTLGREEGELATNIAMQGVEASLDKSSKKGKTKAGNLLLGLGGALNIVDIDAKDKVLTATLKDVNISSKALLRLSGTKSVKIAGNKIEIIYADGADSMHTQLQEEMTKAPVKTSKDKNNVMLENIFLGLGGRDNVKLLDNCATRLRVTVIDETKVDDKILKSTGAAGIFKKGTAVQVIYGPQVGNIKNDLLKTWTPK